MSAVELVLEPGAGEQLAQDSALVGAPRHLAVVPPAGSPPRCVLVIDDDDDDAFLIRTGLERVDPSMEVDTAATYGDALLAMRRKTYDAVVVDYRLGAANGVELIERCRQAGHQTPFILLTGQGGVDVDIEAMRRGAADYLEKREMTPALLERAIRYAIERNAAEAELMAAKGRFEAAVQGSNDGIWDWDIKSAVLYMSPRFKEMLGFEDSALPSTRAAWFERVHPDDRARLESAFRDHTAGKTEHLEVEYQAQHKDGSWRWMLLRGTLQYDHTGKCVRLAGSQSDITLRKQAEEQARHQALHDPLTSLANRALLIDRLHHAVQRIQRDPGYGFSLMYIDLDGFKAINDTHGHAAGDVVLMETAARLKETVRAVDTVARIGGDEFVVLLDRCARDEDATLVRKHVEGALTEPISLPEGEDDVTVGASIGLRTVQSAVDNPLSLLADADHEMYLVKSARKQSTVREVPDARPRTRTLARDLRRALERDEIRAHYQPILHARTATVVGYEALARWTHEERGPVGPNEFIPVAHEVGLIGKLGQSMLRQACNWAAARPEQPTISVNVGPEHLASPEFVDHVEAALRESGLPSNRLRLELTEHAALEDEDAALDSLRALTVQGVQLELDDFGTGYSAISLVTRLPFSTIKLDRSLIKDICDDPGRIRVVRAMVELGHSLGLSVTAEGIETEREWRTVIGQHVDFVQGYYFGRPEADPPVPSK